MTVTANLFCALSAWSNQTYSVGNCVSAGGNAYRCTTGGTTPTQPSGTSTTPTSFGAGSSKWVWLSAITFSGATANAVFSAAIAGSTASGGLTGSITQPIIWNLWNTNGATWQTSAAGTVFLALTGHSFTPTNNLTITAAPGEGFRDRGSSNALAFNAANGVSFTLPATTGTTNYFEITDPNVTFDGIQFKDPAATSGSTVLSINSGANNFHLRNCIIDGTSQSGGADIVGLGSGVTGTLFTNSVIIDRQPANSNIAPIKDAPASASAATFVNCTFVAINSQNAGAAIVSNGTGANSWVVRNCVSIGYANGLLAAVTPTAGLADHCGTDATQVVNAGATDSGGELVSQTVANMFVSSTTDFRLKAGSPFLNAGVTDTTNIPTADDIFRTTRPQGTSWDMGAAELSSGAYLATLTDNATTTGVFSSGINYSVTLNSDTAVSSDAFAPAAGADPWSAEWSSEYGTGQSVVTGYNATFGDSAASSDSLPVPVLGFKQNPGDSAVSSDGFVSLAYYAAIPADNAFAGDSYSTGIGAYAANISDIAVTSEFLTTSIIVTSFDITASSDLLSYTVNGPVTLNETSVVSSDVRNALSFGIAAVSLADTATLTENYQGLTTGSDPYSGDFSVNFGSGLPTAFFTNLSTDTVVTSGVFAWQALILSLNDSAATSDVAAVNAAALSFADTSISSEAYNYSISGNYSISVGDVSTTFDAYLGSSPLGAIGYFQIGVSAIGGLDFAYASLVDPNVAGTDAYVPPTATYINTLGDAAVVSSDNLSFAALSLALTDSVTTSDTWTVALITAGSLTDSAVSSESWLPTFNLGAGNINSTLTDTSVLADALASSFTAIPVSLTDITTSPDILTIIAVAVLASRADSAANSDSLTASLSLFAAVLTDTVTSSESLNSASSIAAIFGDTAATSDVASLSAAAQSLTDSLVTAEVLTPAIFVIAATLGVNSAVSSDAVALVSTSIGTSDSAAGSDSVTATQTGIAALADSATGSENLSGLLSNISVTLGDIATSSSVVASSTVTFTVAMADAAVVSDLASSVLTVVSVTLSDSVATADKFNYLTYISTFVDTVSTRDSFSGYAAFPLADTAFISDRWVSASVGIAPVIIATVIPTGGAVLLQFPNYFPPAPLATVLTISRSVTGSGIWTVIYQGPPVGVFIDVGDGTAGPLNPALSYVWQAVDQTGISITESLMPASSFISQPDQLTQILLRLLQGAVNSMTLPAGVQRPLLTIRMPTNGWQAMPFIVLNLDLIQQTEVEVGEDVVNPTPNNIWTLFANAKRVWRVTIMSQDSEERDFYRDSLLAVFRVLKATAFGPMGLDVSHTFQAESYSNVSEASGVTPGFYAADLMLEINGIFPAAVLTNYPVILEIASNPTWLLNTFNETLGAME